MKSTFRAALMLTAASGAAALSHELLWTRRLIDLLGATGEATSRVFGCFFLGLALGGLLAARLLARLERPWLAVAYSEIAIAILATPALCLPLWTDWIWPVLGPDLLVSWQGTLLKTVLSAVVVLPPAIAMGMTLPFLVAAATQRQDASPGEGVWLYGLNTLGGVLGLLLTGSLLLERLGVAGCMGLATAVNVLLGLLAWQYGRSSTPASPPINSRQRRKRRNRNRLRDANKFEGLSFRTCLALSFFSGLALLALEVLSIRLISLVVPSSFQATSAVLATVILVLAVAAILTPVLLRLWSSRVGWLIVAHVGAMIFCCLAPRFLYTHSRQLVDVSHLAAMAETRLETTTQFLVSVCGLAIATIGPALMLGGLIFPTILASAGSDDQGTSPGRRFGYLLAANGIGGILGAELTHLVVLPAWGIYQGFAVVGVLFALGTLSTLITLPRRQVLKYLAAPALIFVPIGWGIINLSHVPYLSPRTTISYDIQATEFGREGVLLVVETPSRGTGILLNNQYMLGSSGSTRDERREVLLPMLLHPRPERVCCIGLATGISAGAALDFPTDCQLTAVEISSLVTDAAKNYFGAFNNRLFEESRAEVIVEDGRTFLAAVDSKFDVVVGDLYRPYGAGEGRLYSIEHFQAARRSLRQGGVFCQWLPMYQLTESQFCLIAATFLEAFPAAELVRGNWKSNFPLLGIVGWRDRPEDFAHLEVVCQVLSESNRIDDEQLLRPEAIKKMCLGRLDGDRFRNQPLNTLNNARIEILAGRRKITRDPRTSPSSNVGQEPYLVDGAWDEFVDRFDEFLSLPKVSTKPVSASDKSAAKSE